MMCDRALFLCTAVHALLFCTIDRARQARQVLKSVSGTDSEAERRKKQFDWR